MTTSRVRVLLAAIGVLCFALLAYAYFLQYGPDKQQPCPLCVLQRYVYFVVGVDALVAAAFARRGLAFGTAIVAAVGIALALWQVLKGADMTSCLRDPVGIFVNGLPMADWWPEFLFANGGCADKFYTLGLPVPMWSLLCFTGLFAVLLYLGFKLKRTR